jgi:hypothetical protein
LILGKLSGTRPGDAPADPFPNATKVPAMPLKVSCAKCGGVLHAPDDAGGKKGKCPNCGNILPIPLDAPKVTESQGGLEGLPATQGVGNPAPRPPEPRGFGSTAGVAAGAASRVAADPKPFGASGGQLPNPFNPPDPTRQSRLTRPGGHAVGFTGGGPPAGTKGWVRTRRGLWWVRTGVVLLLIAGVGSAVVAAAGPLHIPIPDKDPGYLNIPRVSFVGELFLGVGLIPTLLGILCVVLGRFGVANAPASSGVRGTALWAAVFSLLALVGAVAFLCFMEEQVRTGSAPRLDPSADILNRRDWNFQKRVTEYAGQTLLPAEEFSGQVCRFGLLAVVIFGLLAESWFTGAVGRIGAHFADRRTARRTTFLCWCGSVLAAAVLFAWLSYTLFESELREPMAKWNGLAPATRGGIAAGVLGGIVLIGTVLYIRMLTAARAAIANRLG